MATNTTLENTSPALKRKADEGGRAFEEQQLRADGKNWVIEVPETPEKKQRTENEGHPAPQEADIKASTSSVLLKSSLVELKGQKLVFKQDPLPKDTTYKKRP